MTNKNIANLFELINQSTKQLDEIDKNCDLHTYMKLVLEKQEDICLKTTEDLKSSIFYSGYSLSTGKIEKLNCSSMKEAKKEAVNVYSNEKDINKQIKMFNDGVIFYSRKLINDFYFKHYFCVNVAFDKLNEEDLNNKKKQIFDALWCKSYSENNSKGYVEVIKGIEELKELTNLILKINKSISSKTSLQAEDTNYLWI